VSFLHWFAGADDEPWRQIIKNRPVEAINEDSGEIISIKPAQNDPNHVEGLLVGFHYVDANNNRSTRDLLCWRCWIAHNVIYVQGYCTLRRELRTFRVDRMSDAEEVRTGQKIVDPIAYFESFADRESDVDYDDHRTGLHGSGDAQAVRARNACVDALRIFAYFAALQGELKDKQRALERQYVERRLFLSGLGGDERLVEAMMKIAESLAVPSSSFTRAISGVITEKLNFELVCGVVRGIAVDLRSSEGELAAVKELLAAGESRGWVSK
jgi:hypothetical protein